MNFSIDFIIIFINGGLHEHCSNKRLLNVLKQNDHSTCILCISISQHQIDPSGAILAFDRSFPWREHLFDIEKEQKDNLGDQIKYVLYPDANQSWRIQAVPLDSQSFANRLPLPKEWQGLRDDELSTKSGIPGCVFVHTTGFIGGNATYDGVLTMARRALEIGKNN